MNRRNLLQNAVMAGTALGLGLPVVRAADYVGKLFVFVQAGGGWDPTSFCDPKTNAPDERPINHWAEEAEIRQAGGIAYAPFADNEAFFEKHHRSMLVINGVDAQTNSHDTGTTYNWSGKNSDGYPSLTALLAAHHAPNLPMPYLTFGGYSRTQGVTKALRLSGTDALQTVFSDPFAHLSPAYGPQLARHVAAQSRALPRGAALVPRDLRSRNDYAAAFDNEDFSAFADALPDEFEPGGLRAQAQVAVHAFAAGMAVSADLHIGGFDTHSQHDQRQATQLAVLTNGVDFLWEYAERHGMASRLVVLIGSDFGRTNYYNEDEGKDHWPIGSYVVMQQGQPWTDRVVGETDGLHYARQINPATLRRDDADGVVIHPRHVHKALRRHLGMEQSPIAGRFPFNHTEDFAFFG